MKDSVCLPLNPHALLNHGTCNPHHLVTGSVRCAGWDSPTTLNTKLASSISWNAKSLPVGLRTADFSCDRATTKDNPQQFCNGGTRRPRDNRTEIQLSKAVTQINERVDRAARHEKRVMAYNHYETFHACLGYHCETSSIWKRPGVTVWFRTGATYPSITLLRQGAFLNIFEEKRRW